MAYSSKSCNGGTDYLACHDFDQWSSDSDFDTTESSPEKATFQGKRRNDVMASPKLRPTKTLSKGLPELVLPPSLCL